MNNTLKYIFAALVVIVLVLGSFAGGFVTGQFVPVAGIPGIPGFEQPVISAEPTISPEQQAAIAADTQALFAPFWEAWTIIHENYVNQPVDDMALMRGAINGMMQALGDKHSTYMDPTTYEQANSSLEGEYEGIGAYVDVTTTYLTITSPMPGSPAERAGLQPGDQVVAINGEDMTGTIAEVARSKIIGPAGTTVHLTVFREGEAALLEFDVVREKITIKSASGKMLENDIAYVQITTFGAKTTAELLETLTDLMAQNPKGIILDLRNNGGGYLQTSVEVISQFAGEGVALYEQYGNGERRTYDVLPGGLATDTNIPMVVLINEGSASASEIVAGALQDYGRATLVGVVSYGKGSVQNWIPLSGDNGAVRITIAKWLTPNEHTIHEIGLTPDVFVEMTEEDYKAKLDPQLDAAIETLLAMISGNPIPTSMPTAVPSAVPTQP
ncbi:MAG: S41 family peptidase [Anaerolineales bacterium]|nr:S41 family peptidase [Anaerolineales bacterium]